MILDCTRILTCEYSGGTKRKVSATIAVMLPRSLVVLDEPTTGLEPLA